MVYTAWHISILILAGVLALINLAIGWIKFKRWRKKNKIKFIKSFKFNNKGKPPKKPPEDKPREKPG